MNPIYLSRIVLSDFRSYGPNFSLKLPEGRGLTMVVGTNGLGKSGMFEAIEWALTGGIDRLIGIKSPQKEKDESLVRLGSGSVSPRVELGFSNGESIVRSYTDSTSEEKIKEILVAPGWEELTRLDTYLRFTHFLGQSSNQRFVARTPEDRWRYIQGPIRIEDFSALSRKLGGYSMTTAFTNMERELTERREMYRQELLRLEELLTSQKTVEKIARASLALDPEQAKARLLELYVAMSDLAPDLPALAGQDDIGNLFAQGASTLQSIRSRLAERRIQVAGLSSLASEYPALIRDADQLRGNLKILVKESDATGQARNLLIESEKKARETLAGLNESIKAIDFKLGRLNWLRSSMQSVIEKKLTLIKIDASQSQYNERRKPILEAIAQLQSEINACTELQSRRNTLVESRARLESLKSRFDDFLVVQENHQNCCTAWKSASAGKEILEDKLRSLSIEVEDLDKQRNELQSRIETVRVKTDVIRSAVAMIAANLIEEETICPVCQVYHERGRLKAAVKRAAEESSPQLIALELHAAELDKIRQTKSGDIQATQITLANISEKEESLSKAATSLAILTSELRLAPELCDEPLENFCDVIANAMAAVHQDIALVEVAIRKTRDPFALGAEKVDLERQAAEVDHAIHKLHTKGLELLNELTDLETQIQMGREELNVETDGLQTLIDRFLAERLKLAESLPILESNVHVAERDHLEKDQKIAQFEHRVKELRDKITEIEHKAALDMEKWRQVNPVGTPSSNVWQELMDNLDMSEKRLDLLFERHHSLVEGYETWHQHAILQETKAHIREMAKQYSVASTEELTHKLKAELALSESRLAKLLETRRTRDQLSKAIHESNKQLCSQLLEPLNESIEAISATLLPGHNRKEKVALEAKLRKTNSCIFFNQYAVGEEVKRNPELYLSEGQMAALNISLLISASTTYPWSQWKALLLDDPLQHNDVIRSSAFIDLLRNMIMDQGYQVILSSHDIDEANYFLRKCTNTGVSTAYCHLLAPSDQGVIWTAG